MLAYSSSIMYAGAEGADVTKQSSDCGRLESFVVGRGSTGFVGFLYVTNELKPKTGFSLA